MKTVDFDPMPGSYINDVCRAARRTAKDQRCRVRFRCNGCLMVATPKTSETTLRWLYAKLSGDDAAIYRQSRGYRAYLAKREAELDAKRSQLRDLMSTLDQATSAGLDSAVRWIGSLAAIADDIDLGLDKPRLYRALQDAGYQDGAHVGQPPEAFTTRKMIGEWLVGQAMSCLRQNLPPHPITLCFVKQYFENVDS